VIKLLITYSLLDFGTWIGIALAFIAGLINLGRVPMVMMLIALFGLRVFETYGPEAGFTPFPYVMGFVAVVMAIIAHIAGLVMSSILWSMRHR
jgi:hypothetical protein